MSSEWYLKRRRKLVRLNLREAGEKEQQKKMWTILESGGHWSLLFSSESMSSFFTWAILPQLQINRVLRPRIASIKRGSNRTGSFLLSHTHYICKWHWDVWILTRIASGGGKAQHKAAACHDRNPSTHIVTYSLKEWVWSCWSQMTSPAPLKLYCFVRPK